MNNTILKTMHKKTKGLLRNSYSPGLFLRLVMLLAVAASGLAAGAQTPQTITSRPAYTGDVTAALFIADVPGGVTRKVSGATILNTLRADTNSVLATRTWVLNNVASSTGGTGGAVSSVFGRTGPVTALASDYSAFYGTLSGQNTNTANIATNTTNITTLQGFFNAGILKNTAFPALTGDVTTSAGALATTLAASGVSAGTYGDATHVPVITVDAKGRATTVTTALISAGLTNPMTTQYDLIVGGASGTPTRQAAGSNGQYLGVRAGAVGYYAIQAGDVPNITESQVTSLTADLAAKQGSLTLTTTGTSGAATLVGSTLNIPQYSGGGGSSFPTQQVDATTGTTVTVTNQTTNIWLIKNPAATVASYTITFPATPVDGQRMWISFGGTISSGVVVSSLSVAGNTFNILQNSFPSTVNAGETLEYQFTNSNNTWYRIK